MSPIIPQKKRRVYKKKLALIIAAHNEELVLENTIRSAIKAGMRLEDIFVVDDNSSDATTDIAIQILGPMNCVKVLRSGKGLALTKGMRHFGLIKRYQWIHIADADGAFSPNYFKTFRRKLRVKYVAATGYVKSLPGGVISDYRAFEYTIGMELHRRFQALTHTVSVIPGPTSCFRADTIEKLNFANESPTEDFDVTLQIHRQKLGKVQFIHQAIAHTQDPKNLQDYTKQISRWNKGVIYGMRRHKIGRKLNRIDIYLSYQMIQTGLFFLNYVVLAPYLAVMHDSANYLAIAFLYDLLITAVLTILVAIRLRRFSIISALPNIYAMKWYSLFVFIKTLFQYGLRSQKDVASNGIWSTAGRRYKPTSL